MATNHNLSRGLSPSAGSYISLRNSGRHVRVTGRRGSPLPRRAAASTASGTSRAEAPKPGRKDVPRVAPAEAPPATRSRHETAPAITVASLVIGPRSIDNHESTRPPCRQVVEEEPALLLAHAPIELSPAASAASALLHLDEPRAHALLGDSSNSDKTDGWRPDTGITHHMTGR
jgi:hypothetical protein